MTKGRIVVGLSGGVDSSVAALLLQRDGWDVTGLFMKNWEDDDDTEYCAASADLEDAQSVADKLGIELRTVNFASEYWDRVFTHFLDEYRAGRTPNPDVLCNREIKFRAFLDHALTLGAARIATGHYATIGGTATEPLTLQRAADEVKDQTYFLYMLDQRALQHSVFPLARLDKTSVRNLAAEAGLSTAKKKDSTGICFIGERRFRDFLARYLPSQPGEIVDLAGRPIGRHHGLMYHTLGQRHGLGIGGQADAADAPWFVVEKDLTNNRLVVAQGHDHPRLYCDRLRATQLHWVSGEAPLNTSRCMARCRHRQPLQGCEITIVDNRLEVMFDTPQRALTPGQSIVLYDDRVCLGGGIIEGASRTVEQ
jgi:tRNA-specific 2-thiouridylase